MKWELLVLVCLVVIASGCTSSEPQTPEQDQNMDQPENPEEPADTGDQPDSDETTEDTQNNNDNQQPQSDGNLIYYTDSGFQPQSLTIALGEEVTWINNASTQMWVASDEHPWHTNYAGDNLRSHCQDGEPTRDSAFDQCSTGDPYSFTFQKTGTWGFHNHEASQHTGEITVE